MPFLIPVAIAFATGAAGAAASGATIFGLTGLLADAAIGGIDAALTLGSELLSSALTPKPKPPGQQLSVSLDPYQPPTGAGGQTATAGSLVTFQTWGDNNENIILVFALADHKCFGLAGAWWMGEPIQINPDGSVVQGEYKGDKYLWVRFYQGDWNDEIDPTLLANCGGRWNPGAWGRGVCKVVVQATYNANAHPQGLTGLFQFIWEVQGTALYDRRYDSSVGGGGPQRFDDKSTWGESDNAAVAVENFLRGFREEDTSAPVATRASDTFFGLNLTDQDLPFAPNVAAFVTADEPVAQLNNGSELSGAANSNTSTITLTSTLGLAVGDSITIGANSADAEIIVVSSISGLTIQLASKLAYMHVDGEEVTWTSSPGTAPTVARYSLGGNIPCDSDGQTALGNLLAACGDGRLLTGSGVNYVILPGAANTPLARPDGGSGSTITDADLRLDGPHKFQQYQQLDQIINAVYGRYSNPAQYYTAMALPPRLSTADETEDGGKKDETFDVTYVTNSSQGQRCQEIHRRRARAQMSAQVCLGPSYMCVEAGDWIEWTSDRYGFSATFEVQNARWILDDSQTFLGVVLDLQEIDSSVFDWDPDVDELSMVNPKALPTADPAAAAVEGFTVGVTAISDPVSGAQIPGLVFSWTNVTDIYAVGVTIEWEVVGQPETAASTFSTTYPVDPTTAVAGGVTSLTVTNGVNSALFYQARALEVTVPARLADFTAWTPAAAVTPGTYVALSAAVPWPGVTDPESTRPENNATIGAQVGVNLIDDGGEVLGETDVVTSMGTSANTSNVGSQTAPQVNAALAAVAANPVSDTSVPITLAPPAVSPSLTTAAGVLSATLSAIATPAAGDSNIAGYEFGLTIGSATEQVFPSATPNFSWSVAPGSTYSVRVRAVKYSGTRGAWSGAAAGTVAANTTAPGAATNLMALGGLGANFLTWSNSANADLDHTEIYASTTNVQPTPGGSALVGTVAATPNITGTYYHGGLTTSQTWYYWVVEVNTSGTRSALNATSGVSATPRQLGSSDIASVSTSVLVGQIPAVSVSGVLSTASIPSLDASKIVSGALPAGVSVPAASISGTLTSGQIASVNASVVAGQLAAVNIPGIDASKIISGTIPAAVTVPAANLSGAIAASRITAVNTTAILAGALPSGVTIPAPSVSGTLTASQIASVNASVLSGVLATTNIPNLSASILTSGTISASLITSVNAAAVSGALAVANIPGLPSSIITSGTFTASQIASVNAGVVSGVLATSNIPGIDASKIVSGTIPAAVSVPTVNLTGTVTAAQIASVYATTVSGTLATANIPALSASQITSGAFGSSQIGAGAISASKLAASIGDTGNMVLNPVFAGGSADGWTLQAGTLAQSIGSSAPSPYGIIIPSATTQQSATYNTLFPVTPGAQYYLSIQASATSGSTNSVLYLGLTSFNAAQSASAFSYAGNISTPQGYGPLTGIVTIPATASDGSKIVQAQLLIFTGGVSSPAGDWAVTSVELRKAITSGVIAANTIIAANIAAGTIVSSNIAAGTIVASNIAAGTITGSLIAAGTIVASNIMAGTITATQVAANTLTSSNIVAGSILGSSIAAQTISAGNIVANTITSAQIAAGTIVAANIAGGTITGTLIAANTITGTNLVAGTITAAQIASNTITSGQIAAGTIVAANIAGGTITGTLIAGGTILGSNIAAGTLTAANIQASTITAAQLSIGVGGNLIPNPGSETQGLSGAGGSGVVSYGSAYSGNYVRSINLAAGTSANTINLADAPYIPCAPGDVFLVTAQIKVLSNASGAANGVFYTAAGAQVSASAAYYPTGLASATTSTTGYTLCGISLTAPSTAIAFLPYLSCTQVSSSNSSQAVYDALFCGRMTTGTLIVNGSITGTSIAAATITGGNIAGQTISAANIVANTITSSQIAAGTIVAANIAGGTITGSLIAGATILGTNIAAGTLTANNIAAGTITGTLIAAGTILASNIGAGTITAANLAIGTFGNNLVADGSFASGTKAAFFDNGNLGTIVFNYGPYNNSTCVTLAFNDGGGFYSNAFQVVPGASYACGMTYGGASATSAGAYFRIIYSSTKPTTSYVASGSSTDLVSAASFSSNWVQFNGVWTAPTSASWASVILYNTSTNTNCSFTGLSVAQQLGTTNIANGSITTSQIAAGTIVAGNIAAGTIVAANIASATITGTLIAANTITGSNIQAGTITASNIQSGTITSTQIQAGSIVAASLNVSTLSSISANIGTVTAGLISSAAGQTFFDVTNARMQLYNSGSGLVTRLGALGSNIPFWVGASSVGIGSETNANAQISLDGSGVWIKGALADAGPTHNQVQPLSGTGGSGTVAAGTAANGQGNGGSPGGSATVASASLSIGKTSGLIQVTAIFAITGGTFMFSIQLVCGSNTLTLLQGGPQALNGVTASTPFTAVPAAYTGTCTINVNVTNSSTTTAGNYNGCSVSGAYLA